MEILLGLEERKSVYAGVRWHGLFRDLREREDEALCRAQVRKVVEWLENNPETDIDEGTLIALRKAGGGEAPTTRDSFLAPGDMCDSAWYKRDPDGIDCMKGRPFTLRWERPKAAGGEG